ncbi:MAG: TldD/PmbA family protein [Candidatus Bathyarchaeia archaeon]
MEVPEKNTMSSIAENIVKVALKLGASDAEAYVYKGQATNIGIELGQINKTNCIIDQGVGIRVAVNKAVGFAYTNIIENNNAIEKVVKRALSAARASKPDNDWNGLPCRKPYGSAEGTFDQKIVELKAEELVNTASTMLDAAKEVNESVLAVEGGVGNGFFLTAIANSEGILAFDRGTIAECSLATVARDGNTVTPICFEFDAGRSYNLNPKWVGREAARIAVSALKPEPVETKTTQVIFTQFALQELLTYTLINGIKADSVQRNQSAFKNKIGEAVATENLTIYDDGLYKGGLHTSVFDGEGVPSQKTLVVEEGVLRNFLYDSYTAKKQNTESTGNASRAGYLSTPSIDITNFCIMPQNMTGEQMISEVNEGLIVYNLQGAHSSNPISGEFSVVAASAWKIKHGEAGRSCRGAMLAGNIFDLLKNIGCIGNNCRQIGSLVSPWVQFENVKVIGK